MRTYTISSGDLRYVVVRVTGGPTAAIRKAVRLYKPDLLGALAKITELNREPVYLSTREILQRSGLYK